MEVSGKRQHSDDEKNAKNNNKICEPCQNENTMTPANGFCKDCWEFMCNNCFRQHLKGKLCRHHVLMDCDLSQLSFQSDEHKTSCKQHDGETVKFYCRTHEVVGCGDCMVLEHNACKSEFIKDLSDNFQQNKEYEALKGNIEKLISEKKDSEKEIQDHQRDNKLMLVKALGDIRQFRLDINKYLDKVEADVISEAKGIMRENETLLTKLENDCKALSTKLEKMTAMLNSGLFKDILFIHTVECKPKVPEIELAISDMKSKTMIKKYEFVPETQLRGLSASVKRLGTLSISTSRKPGKDGKSTVEGGAKEKKVAPRGEEDDIVFETFRHRSGEEFQCIFQSGMRFYLDDWGSKGWQPFPKRWYNEGLLVTDSILGAEKKSEEANRASALSQLWSKQDQRQGLGGGDDREGFLMHPTKGRVPTYIFYKKHNVHMYFDRDTGSWVRMPISWELHHDMVKGLVDEVDEAVPTWGDRHDILAQLRACNYDPHECISIYKHLENDEWMKKTINRPGSKEPKTGKKDIRGLQTECACYGNDVMLNCTSSGGFISIDLVYIGAKLPSDECSNSTTGNETNCCTYDGASDCRIDLTSSDVPDVFSDCSGAVNCSKQITWQSTFSDCNNTYILDSNYTCMDYNCIPSTDVLEFCDTSGAQVVANTSYFHNDGYPSTISHSNCCACVITASAASATIDLDILDLQLYNQSSTCMQTVFITDNTGVASYNCTENNEYIVRNLLTTGGSSLTVTLKSEVAANGNGKALFRASVSVGELNTTCGPVAVCPDEVTTPQSSTDGSSTADQSSGTSPSSDTTKETWFFGLSAEISVIILAGLFLTLVLLFLLFCVVCYKLGKSKSSRVTPGPTEPSEHLHVNMRSGVLSYTRTTKTGIQFVRSVDFDLPDHSNSSETASTVSPRANAFVYRPFENRSSLTNNYRRQNLVRVESP